MFFFFSGYFGGPSPPPGSRLLPGGGGTGVGGTGVIDSYGGTGGRVPVNGIPFPPGYPLYNPDNLRSTPYYPSGEHTLVAKLFFIKKDDEIPMFFYLCPLRRHYFYPKCFYLTLY